MVATVVQANVPGSSSASNSASSANAVPLSPLETLGTQPTAAEQQRISDLQEQFQQQAQKDPAGFRLALQAAFGDKASLAQIDQLLDLALSGKLPMPSNIQFVEAGSLGSGALGAYDANNGGSLYLDRSLLSDPEKLQSVFNEEMGHHLDALLGGADAAGDEGAVFTRTLEQGTLSQSELTALKNEDDHGVIQIGGRWVQVEFREEGGDDSGGDTGGDDGGGSGSSSSGGTDSGGGECSVDSGGGNTGSGASGSESTGNDDGSSDSGDTGGECSVDESNDNGSTQGTDDTDDPDENTGSHENGNSDSDRARDTEEANSTDTQANGVQADGVQTGGVAGDTPGADTEPATEPKPEEEKGFWSRALDAVQTGLDVAGFVPGFGAVPDLINAGIHLARGNKAEAVISAAAAIPGAGDAFKAGAMGVKAADRVNDGRRALDKASELSKAGQQPDKNGLTKAGRALQKHGDREGSAFPRSTGSAAERNQRGQDILEGILSSDKQHSRPNRFGGDDIYDGNTGRGVRFDGDGNMKGFLEP